MKNLFVRFVREENGQDLIEYSLLAALISVGSIAVMNPLSTAINSVFTHVTTALGPHRSWLSGAIGSAVLPSRRVSFARGVHIT